MGTQLVGTRPSRSPLVGTPQDTAQPRIAPRMRTPLLPRPSAAPRPPDSSLLPLVERRHLFANRRSGAWHCPSAASSGLEAGRDSRSIEFLDWLRRMVRGEDWLR